MRPLARKQSTGVVMKLFIAMMATFMASVAISIDAMLPALGQIGADLGVTDMNHTQYILVLIFAGMAVGQMIAGPLSDAVGRKKILYLGLAIYAVGSVVSMGANSMTMMLAGLACGWLAAPTGMAVIDTAQLDAVLPWVMLPAHVFMALITLIVMPLVFTSIMLAVCANNNGGFVRRAGAIVVVYFIISTALAVMLGMALSWLINPAQYVGGSWGDLVQQHNAQSALAAVGGGDAGNSIPAMIAGLIPANPATMFVTQNMLHIVIAAAIAGFAVLSLATTQRELLTRIADAVQAACMKVVDWAMLIAPFAVFAFLFRLVATMGSAAFETLGAYVATVLIGLVCIMLAYMAVVAVIARRNPVTFLRQCRDALMLAFSSSSSAATMPLSLETAEEKLHVRPAVARLVIPLGTTINMDGTAIYQIIVALFLVDLMGIDLTAAQTALLGITVVGAAIGSPGTPGVGIVILGGVLARLGVPPEGIGLILSVDRFLDMCRTTVNVCGDLTASVVMDRIMKE